MKYNKLLIISKIKTGKKRTKIMQKQKQKITRDKVFKCFLFLFHVNAEDEDEEHKQMACKQHTSKKLYTYIYENEESQGNGMVINMYD